MAAAGACVVLTCSPAPCSCLYCGRRPGAGVDVVRVPAAVEGHDLVRPAAPSMMATMAR